MRSALLLLVPLAGCFSHAQIADSLRKTSEPHVQCPASQIAISGYTYGGSSWRAAGCGREFDCYFTTSRYLPNETICRETAASEDLSLERVVVDRLALETGCPREQVSVASEAAWSRGGEHAYRLTACGKAYVCATAPRGTECKAALTQ